MIIEIFHIYLNLQKYRNNTVTIIYKFIKYYVEQILKLYMKNLEEIVKEESQKLINDILDIQIQVNLKNQGYFKNQIL